MKGFQNENLQKQVQAKRTVAAIITLVAILIARASDLSITIYFSPSLSQEANPIAKFIGLHAGIGTMILANMAFVFLVTLWPLWFYWRYPSEPLSLQPKNIREFVSLQLFNRILSRGEFLQFCFLGHPFPRNRLQLIRCFGFAFSWCLVFAGFVAVFGWWNKYFLHWQAYHRFRFCIRIFNEPFADMLLCIPVLYLAAYVFYLREFTEFKANNRMCGIANSANGGNSDSIE